MSRKPITLFIFLLTFLALVFSASLWREGASLYKNRPLEKGDIITIVVNLESEQAFESEGEHGKANNVNIASFGTQEKAEPKAQPSPSAVMTTPQATASPTETSPAQGATAQATQSPQTTTVRSLKNDPLDAFPFLPKMNYSYTVRSSRSATGSAQNSMAFSIAALVQNVNQDGTVALRAESTFRLDDRRQSVEISGTINPRDVKDKRVSSDRVADLSISVNNTPVAAQRPITKADLPKDLQELSEGKTEMLLNYLNSLREHLYK